MNLGKIGPLMKLLIIEGNIRLAERIAYHLAQSYTIDIAPTGEDGLKQVQTNTYEAIILDLSLPDMEGEAACRAIRKSSITTPIVVISGSGDVQTKVAILECGADSVLVKPIIPAELIANIRVLSRRQTREYGTDIITIGTLVIDLGRRLVTRSNVPISLRRKEFDILEYLAVNKGRVVNRMDITKQLQSNTEQSSKTSYSIDVHMKHLRDKIDRPFEKALLKTIYGIGYILDDPEQ